MGDGRMSGRTIGTARRLWGLVYLRGAAYLVVGVVLLWRPEEGLTWLRWLVGAVIVAQGVLLVVEGRPDRTPEGGGATWRLVAGVVSVVAGVLVVAWPSMTGPILFRVVGVWACLAGVLGVVGALRARTSRATGWDWQLVNAALWLVLGVVMLARPTTSVATAALLIGLYLVVAGVVLLVGGFATGTAVRDARGESAVPPPVGDEAAARLAAPGDAAG
ncbi:HdeD family acid-resistance protein [Cellulosimicrobium protaetiae]|uniref:DUF308 domain-containing protein n=1 Tax=Cellulosimicrobium protaetiae TaxID=2587808 RepID=A0A6M5U9H7_9MICO|nr:DUF308 domain-containing protein [Cellulosimicrobium protaetiae]QJW35127.1 hypothetical protein FIC82_001765 [Cellulosimicrobium protaetiae]